MSDFDIVGAESLSEALGLIGGDDPTVRAMSGGTALMLMMKSGMFQPSCLINLQPLAARHNEIALSADGGLLIGAMATMSELEHSPVAQRAAPVIAQAMKRLANVRVRNVACIGGCLAHGDPHMDLPPIFTALGAHISIVGAKGVRTIPVESLFVGYYETSLQPGELIVQVRVPPQNGRTTRYCKITTKTHDDWPALGIALSMSLDKGRLIAPRVVVSAATDKVTRLLDTEAALDGLAVTEGFDTACAIAAGEAVLMEDSRGSADYKAHLLRIHLHRALIDIAAGGPDGVRA